MDTIYPAALAYNISRGHYLPGELGEGANCKFSEGHYLPCGLTAQY